METFVDEQFPLKLPLKDIVLRAIAVNLWSRTDVSDFLKMIPVTLYCDEENEDEFLEIFESILKWKASNLELPNSLEEEIMRLAMPIGLEIFRWIKFHNSILEMRRLDFCIRFVKRLIWTSAGTIDYRKTARELARCEMLDVVEHFKVACLYCLEDEISTIWEELCGTNKTYFYNDAGPDALPFTPELPLEFSWANVLREEGSKLDGAPERRFCQNAFETAAVRGNQAAAEYFFQKLTSDERETSLVRTTKAVLAERIVDIHEPAQTFPRENLSDVLCYLLTVMTPEQRMTICNELPFQILQCLMDWPRHDHFEAFAGLLSFLSPEDLYKNYKRFVTTPALTCQLFQKFFPLSSTDFKKYFVDRACESGSKFPGFVTFSEENMRAFFRNVDVEDRVRLVSCEHFIDFVLSSLIMYNRWHLIEYCFREATLSKEDCMSVKKIYAKRFEVRSIHYGNKLISTKRFFEILDKLNAEYPLKRNSNDQTSGGKNLR